VCGFQTLENLNEKPIILQAVGIGLDAAGKWRHGTEMAILGVAVGQD